MPTMPTSPRAARLGRTPTGHTFQVPPTTDMFRTLVSPRLWGPAELLTLALLSLTLLSLLLPPSARPPYVLLFCFWRLSYNLVLAVLLRMQSSRLALTRWLAARSPAACALLHWFCARSTPAPYAWHSVPPDFNAWLCFRSLCMVVLANDGVSYAALAAACFRPCAESSAWTLAIGFPAGAALLALSFWSKAAAHRVLGDFAWYWGDFFFTIEEGLVFEGVFELFPHPMYTVGYAGYYGAALICRSYTLLLVSLLAHLAQLGFLILVEEPHIRKIYASPAAKPAPASVEGPQGAAFAVSPTGSTAGATATGIANANASASASAVANASSSSSVSASASANAGAPGAGEMQTVDTSDYGIFVATVPQPAVIGVASAVLLTLILLAAATPCSPAVAVALLLSWRALHWGSCAMFLRNDGDGAPNVWMRVCLGRGSTASQAYSSWQHAFLFSFMTNHALFLIAAFTLPAGPASYGWESYSFAKDWSYILGGVSLMAVSVVAVLSAWSATGKFGFYYGDFFVLPQSRELTQSGAFRYVSNPEASLGYLMYYGLAVGRQSSGVLALAVICHVSHLVFIWAVEEAHVESAYKSGRPRTALEARMWTLPVVRTLATCAVQFRGAVEESGGSGMESLSKQLVVRRQKLMADLKKTKTKVWEGQVVRRAGALKTAAAERIGTLDCDKCVAMLERGGAVVHAVENYAELTAANSNVPAGVHT